MGTKRPQSEEHLSSLQYRYRKLLGLAENDPVPLPNVAAPQDLPLLPEVKVRTKHTFFKLRTYSHPLGVVG